MKSIKKTTNKKLDKIRYEIEKEKFLSIETEDYATEILTLESKLNFKFLNLKLDLIDINFTLKEICNFIKV